MATVKKANRRKKAPSPAQLRARRAFARMAKQRAKDARARRRNEAAKLKAKNARKRPASRKLSTTKNGLFSRARRRAKGVRRKARGRIRSRLQTKLFNPRRRNDGAQELRSTFSGLPQDQVTEMTAPEGTPAHVVEMGDLLQLKTSKETIDFEQGEAVLAVDSKEKLHILAPVGNNSTFDTFEDLGQIEQITYGADKKDGSGYVEYYHNFGEEGGTKPTLETDREAMLHIKGGSYTIDEVFTNPMRRRLKRRANRRRR